MAAPTEYVDEEDTVDSTVEVEVVEANERDKLETDVDEMADEGGVDMEEVELEVGIEVLCEGVASAETLMDDEVEEEVDEGAMVSANEVEEMEVNEEEEEEELLGALLVTELLDILRGVEMGRRIETGCGLVSTMVGAIDTSDTSGRACTASTSSDLAAAG